MPPSQQVTNQRVNQLSQIYKNPLRQMFSQNEEVTLNIVNELIQNLTTLEFKNKALVEELEKLKPKEEKPVPKNIK